MGIIVLDSSVILAIVLPEKDAERYASVLAGAENIRLSAVNYMEASIVYASRVEANQAFARIDALISKLGVTVDSIGPAQAALARAAFLGFGKGRHPAALNMGDCFAYGLAKEYNAPLLFKGNDFSKTDIVSALA